MSEAIVSDSTCLIGLERVGCLDILPALFDSVTIPPEVEREFGGKFAWLKVEKLPNNLLVAALEMVIDEGETEAIALASEKTCLLISDDKQARTAAKRLGELQFADSLVSEKFLQSFANRLRYFTI